MYIYMYMSIDVDICDVDLQVHIQFKRKCIFRHVRWHLQCDTHTYYIYMSWASVSMLDIQKKGCLIYTI